MEIGDWKKRRLSLPAVIPAKVGIQSDKGENPFSFGSGAGGTPAPLKENRKKTKKVFFCRFQLDSRFRGNDAGGSAGTTAARASLAHLCAFATMGLH